MDKVNTQPTDSTNTQLPIDTTQSPEALRRDFLKRFGGYAATAPLVTFTIFSSRTAKAISSSGGNDGGG